MFNITQTLRILQAQSSPTRLEDMLFLAQARALLTEVKSGTSSGESLPCSFPLSTRAALFGASFSQGGDPNKAVIDLLLKAAVEAPPPAATFASASAPLPASPQIPTQQDDILKTILHQDQLRSKNYETLTSLPSAMNGVLQRTVTPTVRTIPSKSQQASASSVPRKRTPSYSIAEHIRGNKAKKEDTSKNLRLKKTPMGTDTPPIVDASSCHRPMKKRRLLCLLDVATASRAAAPPKSQTTFPLPSLNTTAKPTACWPCLSTFQKQWKTATIQSLSSKTVLTTSQQNEYARDLFQRRLGKTL